MSQMISGSIHQRMLRASLSIAMLALLAGCSSAAPEQLALVEDEPGLAIADDEQGALGDRVATYEPVTTTSSVVVAEGGDVFAPSGAVFVPGRNFVAHATVTEGTVELWEHPDAGAEPAWSLPVPTEFFGDRYFQVLDQQGDWFHVAVPVRPNGTTGWIPVDAVELQEVTTAIEIDLSTYQLTVFDNGEVVLETAVTIGKRNTPTPTGSFYLRDELPWDETSVYGPYVLALSAFSETIDVINGGEAVVAIHGTQRPDLIGTAGSLGCIRVENSVLRQVAGLVEPGTLVTIR